MSLMYLGVSSFWKNQKPAQKTASAATMAMIRSSDAFSIGIDLPNFNADLYFQNRKTELAAIPFRDQPDPMIVGYLAKNRRELSDTARDYLRLLQEHIRKLQPPGVR